MTRVASRVASRRSRVLIINYQVSALCLVLLWAILSSTTLACGDGADTGRDETHIVAVLEAVEATGRGQVVIGRQTPGENIIIRVVRPDELSVLASSARALGLVE